MAKQFVDTTLYRRAAAALGDPFRYERNERYALREVVQAYRDHALLEDIFADAARDALTRRVPRSRKAESGGMYSRVA